MYGKKEIARRLAGQLNLTPAMAADQVDRAVADVLRRIRRGEKATLPGIGVLRQVVGKARVPAATPARRREQ